MSVGVIDFDLHMVQCRSIKSKYYHQNHIENVRTDFQIKSGGKIFEERADLETYYLAKLK